MGSRSKRSLPNLSAVSFSNAKQITVGLPELAKGPYYDFWFTISADDGHKAGGVMPFAIK